MRFCRQLIGDRTETLFPYPRTAKVLIGAVWGLSLALGTVYGSKLMGLDLFVATQHSLPPPWRWLPINFQNYEILFTSLHILLVGLLSFLWLRFAKGYLAVAHACVVGGGAAAISMAVVEIFGDREGPRMTVLEVLFYSNIAFLAFCLLEVILYTCIIVLLLRIVDRAYYCVSKPTCELILVPDQWAELEEDEWEGTLDERTEVE